MKHLNDKDWQEFEKLFPTATYWLTHRELYRERIALMSAHPDNLNDWQKKRLEELNALNESTKESLKGDF